MTESFDPMYKRIIGTKEHDMQLEAQNIELEVGNATVELDAVATVEAYQYHGEWASSPEMFDIVELQLYWTATGKPVSPVWQRLLSDADQQHIVDSLH